MTIRPAFVGPDLNPNRHQTKRLDLFRRIEMVQAWGRGMTLIHQNAPTVTFRQVAGLFIASFARPSFGLNDPATAQETTETANATPQNPSKPLKTPQRHLKDVLLAQLTEQPALSMAALAELNHTSLDSIRHHLLALQSTGRIRHMGPSRGGYWEILDGSKDEGDGV